MRILFISKEGDSSGIWMQCQKEGAKVSAYIDEKWARRIMDGIVPKCESVEEGLKENPDVIVVDLNGLGKLADKLRKDGWRVVGGSELADRLEFDRSYGVKVAQQYGIKVPKTTEFNNVDEAIRFVKKNNKPYAIKCDDNAGGESASYVSKDAEDMIDYLSQQKESGKLGKATFICQEVVRGSEVSTEIWVSNGVPIYPANSTWETKKFLAGELGPRTGCEVSVVCHYEGNQSMLVNKTVGKLLPLLKHSNFTGCIDNNVIVSEDDHEPYFLEWTPRIGYSAIYGYQSILGLPISEYFYRLSRGPFTIPFKAKWGTSLKVSIPPYPTSIENEKASEETYGLQEGVRINGKYGPDFIPIDVQKGKKTDLMCAGVTCIIGECLGRGNSVLEAWRASQKVFKSVEVPNAQGRYTDGVEDPFKRILKLRNWGYDIPNPSGQLSPKETNRSILPLSKPEGSLRG